MNRTGTRRCRGLDAGFTLVELLITVAIIGVITVPLGNFVIQYFINTSTTTARVSESHDEQIAATYFADDVANVGHRVSGALQQSVWRGSFPAGTCGAGVAAANQILLIEWDNVTWNSTNNTESSRIDAAAYVKVTSGRETQLHRYYCHGTGPASPTTDTLLVHNLSNAVTPSVTCSTTCEGTAPNPVPTTISLSVGVKKGATGGQPFTLNLTGQRRQS
jgi:prepilin-type N-terminal cleavage/methylation domain-containing protein